MSHCCCDCENDPVQLSDEQLIKEIRSRKSIGAIQLGYVQEELDVLCQAIKERRIDDALAYLDLMRYPLWDSVEACRSAYAAIKRPPPKVGLWMWR